MALTLLVETIDGHVVNRKDQIIDEELISLGVPRASDGDGVTLPTSFTLSSSDPDDYVNIFRILEEVKDMLKDVGELSESGHYPVHTLKSTRPC